MSALAATWRSNLVHRLNHLPRRCYSTSKDRAKLPDSFEGWKKAFPTPLSIYHRCSLRDPEVAAEVAEAFVPEGVCDKVIVEAFPGPGALTRALLDLPKRRIKKIIVLEEWENYLEWLRPLEALDPRVTVIPQNGHAWSTYQTLKEQYLTDIPTTPWAEEHPNLQFISHIPSTVLGEQLVAQLFRAIPEQQWLYSYGRIPTNYIMLNSIYERLVARGKDKARCKVSVVSEVTADVQHAVPFELLQPYDHIFYPVKTTNTSTVNPQARSVGQPFAAVSVRPFEEQLIKPGKMDVWDYILRRMFVRKASKAAETIPTLAPGAKTVLKMVTNPELPPSEIMNVKQTVRNLSPSDWAILANAFDEWPFKPEELGCGDGFEPLDRHR